MFILSLDTKSFEGNEVTLRAEIARNLIAVANSINQGYVSGECTDLDGNVVGGFDCKTGIDIKVSTRSGPYLSVIQPLDRGFLETNFSTQKTVQQVGVSYVTDTADTFNVSVVEGYREGCEVGNPNNIVVFKYDGVYGGDWTSSSRFFIPEMEEIVAQEEKVELESRKEDE